MLSCSGIWFSVQTVKDPHGAGTWHTNWTESQCSPTLTICTNSVEASSTKWPFTDGSCRPSIKENCFLRSIWPAWISVSKSHPFLSKMLLLCSYNSVSFDLGSSGSTWRKVSQIVGPRVSSLITVIWGVGSSPCGSVFFLAFPSWYFSVSAMVGLFWQTSMSP